MEFKNLSFDEAMDQLEAKITELEKPENENNQKLFDEAMALKDYCDDLIEIREESAARAVSFMAKQEKYIVEPSSALTVAAVMDHAERIGGTKIALVLSGGNIDGELLTRLMNDY